MKSILTALLMTLPVAAAAQSGTVHYNRAVKFNVTLPPGVSEEIRAQVPPARLTSMVMRFTPAGSLLTAAPPSGAAANERAATVVVGGPGASGAVRVAAAPAMAVEAGARGDMIVTRLSMGSSSRTDHEVLQGAYTDLDSGTQVQSVQFMTRPFLVTGERPAIAWKLTTEQSVFLTYPVLKATATHEGKEVEAWFTPQIPVPAGPGDFGGLPGLILAVTVDGGQVSWSATAVDLAAEVGALAKPTEGQKVSREEYEKIVADKLAEVRQQGAVRRGDRIP